MRLFATILLAAGLGLAPDYAIAAEKTHGVAMHGDLKYSPGFKHLEYVNPNAPKGGTVRLNALGTFDSFNGFIVKGNPATGLGFLYDNLMYGTADEAFSQYGQLAEAVEMPKDRSWVAFTLRAQVISDAVNLLSNGWTDSGGTMQDADETTYNLAFITGNVPTPDGGGTYSSTTTVNQRSTLTVPASCLEGATSCDQLDSENLDCTGDIINECSCLFMDTMTTSSAGDWTVSGSELTLSGDDPALFCEDGNTLKIQTIPTGADDPIITIVATRQ